VLHKELDRRQRRPFRSRAVQRQAVGLVFGIKGPQEPFDKEFNNLQARFLPDKVQRDHAFIGSFHPRLVPFVHDELDHAQVEPVHDRRVQESVASLVPGLQAVGIVPKEEPDHGRANSLVGDMKGGPVEQIVPLPNPVGHALYEELEHFDGRPVEGRFVERQVHLLQSIRILLVKGSEAFDRFGLDRILEQAFHPFAVVGVRSSCALLNFDSTDSSADETGGERQGGRTLAGCFSSCCCDKRQGVGAVASVTFLFRQVLLHQTVTSREDSDRSASDLANKNWHRVVGELGCRVVTIQQELTCWRLRISGVYEDSKQSNNGVLDSRVFLFCRSTSA
jgi:hypothetical protein